MKRLLTGLAVWIMILSYVGTGYAQQLKMLHYGIDEGLPSNTVYRVYKDHTGLLWIATDKGISCFNGQQFINYTTADGLPDNEVFFFAEDRQARIWIGTFSGQLCYFQNGQFYTARNKAFLKLPFKMMVNSFHLADDGSITMLFGSRKFINIRDTIVTVFNTPENTEMVRKRTAGNYELLRFDKKIILDANGKRKQDELYSRHKQYTLASSGAENGRIYLVGDSGIYDLDERLLFTVKEPFRNTYYIPALLVTDNNYFLCSRTGLYTNRGVILKDVPVSGIVADNNGNYWVSTLDKGIYCFNKDIGSIKEYTGAYGSVVERAVHIGNEIRYITREGKLYTLEQNKGHVRYLGQFRNKNRIPSGNFDDKGNYLSFTGKGGEYIDGKGNNKVLPGPGNDKAVLAVNNDLYLISAEDIKRISYSDLLHRRKINLLQKYVGLKKEERIYSFALDRQSGDLWYATFNALYKASRNDSLPQKQLPSFSFRKFSFYENYLVGYTDRNELIICNHYDSDHPVTDTLKGYKDVWDRLYPVNSCQLIISSNNNYYLLTLSPSTSKPAYSFRAIENPFIPVHAEYICADSTTFYFFRNGNITTIDKAFLLQPETPAPVVFFSGVKTKNRYYTASGNLSISYAESRNIKVSFSALSFYGKTLEYEYNIGGHLDRWEHTHAGELNIASLPYGSYTIRVRCRSRSSSYSAEAVLNLVIERPYWATWWFVAIIVVTTALVLWLLLLWVLRRIVRKKQKEYQVNLKYQQLEFKSLNALMNPHFIFNSLNNIQALINSNDKYAANKYLGIFSSMIRQNMENISRERITLKQELDLIGNYLKLEKLRFENFLDYRLSVAPGIDTEKIHIPALLVQPLVENAVKHGFPNKRSDNDLVCVSVYREGTLINIEVTDNGIGLKEQPDQPASYHNSYGLNNIRARIQHMQQMEKTVVTFHISVITDDQGRPAGTRACISIGSAIDRS